MTSFSSLTEELQNWAVKQQFSERVAALAYGLWTLDNLDLQKRVDDWRAGIGFSYRPGVEEIAEKICADPELTDVILTIAQEDAHGTLYVPAGVNVVMLPDQGDDVT
jgi:hypothetical protein